MKTILLLFAANAILLLSCNQSENKSVNGASHEHKATPHAQQHTQDHAVGAKKWQTDESTRAHVAKLHTELKAFKLKKDADLASYNAFGTDLTDELNKLISDCRMKGPAHDALHGWLTPFLDHVAKLNKAGTVGEGKRSVEEIEESLNIYYKQFE